MMITDYEKPRAERRPEPSDSGMILAYTIFALGGILVGATGMMLYLNDAVSVVILVKGSRWYEIRGDLKTKPPPQ